MKKYDGMTFRKEGDTTYCSFNLEEALNQDNPRNIFLNGQLYIEAECDRIIDTFFQTSDGCKNACLTNFLKSKYCRFDTKIAWLTMLKKLDSEKGVVDVVDKKIIAALNSIACVRNSFHHYLIYEDALRNVKKATSKLHTKKLSDIEDIDELINCFKKEVTFVYSEIRKLLKKEIERAKN